MNKHRDPWESGNFFYDRKDPWPECSFDDDTYSGYGKAVVAVIEFTVILVMIAAVFAVLSRIIPALFRLV